MVAGQLPLHVGVAVKSCVFPAATEGAVGPTATELRVTTGAVTVISAEAVSVVPLSVAFTKMPSVPAVLPAVNDSEAPVPLIEPIPVFEMLHE
jgi:hypothetical protein